MPTITGDHNAHVSDYTALVCSTNPFQVGETYHMGGVMRTLKACDSKDMPVACYSAQGFAEYKNELPTLRSSGEDLRGSSETLSVEIKSRKYIVRRLMPVECARLQGAPDYWGNIPQKDDMTEDEVVFWNDVRRIKASTEGKSYKDATKEQLVKWYNGLHSDSAEYKMWGNGIAIPNASYVLGRIADFMKEDDECDT